MTFDSLATAQKKQTNIFYLAIIFKNLLFNEFWKNFTMLYFKLGRILYLHMYTLSDSSQVPLKCHLILVKFGSEMNLRRI